MFITRRRIVECKRLGSGSGSAVLKSSNKTFFDHPIYPRAECGEQKRKKRKKRKEKKKLNQVK